MCIAPADMPIEGSGARHLPEEVSGLTPVMRAISETEMVFDPGGTGGSGANIPVYQHELPDLIRKELIKLGLLP